MTKLNAKGSLRLASTAPTPATKWLPPMMPVCLPKTMHGQYLQVCRNLYAEGLWHDDRLPLVVSYLSSAYVVESLTVSLSREGVTSTDGKATLSPAVKGLASAVTTLAKAGACLGLTVVRSQPIIADEAPADGVTGGKWAKAAG